jgi:hypothetical protein|tara:strand:- start:1147 stop:2019 length:873 start_codon:yes stop_codon:yes gene_type:complete
MARNIYFSESVRSEQKLYENIIIESLKMYGQDLYYLPRTIVNENRILGEDVSSKFSNSYKIEMYIENTDGFDGEGDLFTKFGVEIRDEATFIVSKRRWNTTVGKVDNQIDGERPREGDIIFLPMSKSMFEVMHVEHEQPFYQLANLPTFKMRCQLFEYSGEDLDTDLSTIDTIEQTNAYEFDMVLSGVTGSFIVGERVTQTLTDGTILGAEVSKWVSSTNSLSIIHLGGNDGKFHLPSTAKIITGAESNATGTVTSFTEDNQLHGNEQNDDFGNLDFIDFSETNPFGDPN